MVNLYDLILEESIRRNIINADNTVPFYTISVGCHAFNIHNHQHRIYTESGSTANTRLHTLFLAYPGFGKTFLQKQFIDDERYSYIKGSSINCKFEGDMTNAGFVGSIKYSEFSPEPIVIKGVCEERSSSIIGIDEFSSITNAFNQQHNMGFDTNLLKALDSGDVEIRRGPGSRSFHTDFTLWAGVQPARFDIGSGFFRRFFFLVYVPTIEDIDRLKNSETDQVKIDMSKLASIRYGVDKMVADINNKLKTVVFDEQFKHEIKNIAVLHTEQQLYKRMGIGYWLTKYEDIESKLVVSMDDELRRLIKLQSAYRNQTRTITVPSIIWTVIKDEDTVGYNRLRSILLEFGIENQSIVRGINILKQREYIRVDDGTIYINKKEDATFQ